MPAVQLATYDISGGLARSLSTQFLGVQIDLIPHTGVVVDGTEYFFGGGIQRMAHASFKANHGISPISLAEVGVTSKTSAEIFSWLLLLSLLPLLHPNPRITLSNWPSCS
ncbi:hypothetical protein TrLO_g5755 [Triparma laevis f. longispina]|uniref:PPPDE domain-containing protein n=1 Tax=Triparma laevis f. longispina TaxID=1714387 RepID=A0A9W7FGU8_9STRA|nr:hypothetical protein TrLO_g5755 [Triparma laevis f. longispina]